MTASSFVIAIDGPSASGKGTIARRLAAHFGYAHLDTGLLYRAVGLAVLNQGSDPSDAKAAESAAQSLSSMGIETLLADPSLRDDRMSNAASKVATIPAVRAALLKFQQDFWANPPGGKKGAVLDGRDIGTVIAPEAPAKLYVTASVEARADRRFKELQGRGSKTTYEMVLADLKERDSRDSSRAIAPAKPASDAILLDTTDMTADEAFAAALKICAAKIGI